jgi:HlyD family secretion protein
MRLRHLTIGLATGATAIAVLAWAFMPVPLLVETATVTRGAFVQTLDEDGITRVRERYLITAPVSGTLLRPTVKAGDQVARDDIVATIIPSTPELLDPRTRAELIARREAADARLSRAQALVRQAEAASRQAALDVKRLDDLAKQGYASATQREQAALAVDLRSRDLEAARYEADAAFHDVEQSRAAVGRLSEARRESGESASAWKIRAPVPGRILTVIQESGGPVPVGSTLLEIGDVSGLEAVIDVLSNDATRIRPGTSAQLDAGDGVTLEGRVRRVEPAARTRVSALGVEEQRVNVIVDLLNNPPPDCVGDGYRVDAKIELARVEQAIRVPTAALFRDGSRWAVFAVRNGRAARQQIEVGLRNGQMAIVEKGLTPGDVVVIYPSDVLEDNRRVKT